MNNHLEACVRDLVSAICYNIDDTDSVPMETIEEELNKVKALIGKF